ncbi:hypothetical protein DFQ28_002225 [Apophysomyces sp. BC1034]|nr:hypothetical protein DFQ29_001661 [Apophysomyces sp. BC1021]KAG0190306.1 hypothetical protein DFQ28_002225 [Apophysomyces sp. BC1034]
MFWNQAILWPVMVSCSCYIRREKREDVTFAPGEEKLYGMTVAGPATSEAPYYAAGVVRVVEKGNMDICLLETSKALKKASKSKISFDRHKGEAVRVWSFSTPQEKVYVMNRELKIEMPTKFNKRVDELLLFLESCWQLLHLLMQSVDTLQGLEDDHVQKKQRLDTKKTATP